MVDTPLFPIGQNAALHVARECVTVTDHAPILNRNLVGTTAVALDVPSTLCHASKVVKVISVLTFGTGRENDEGLHRSRKLFS